MDDPPNLRVEPLTRRRSDGTLYQRDPDVEAQIAKTLALPREDLLARAREADPATPGYLREEALIFLIRTYVRSEDDELVSALSENLLGRCAQRIQETIWLPDEEDVNDVFGEVIERLFKLIMGLDSNRGDFLQVRFWMAFKRMSISVAERLLRDQKRTQRRHIPLAHLEEHERKPGNGQSRMTIPLALNTNPREVVERVVVAREGLGYINDNGNKLAAYILRNMYGWQIESKDPNKDTISKVLGVTPRTVQNWLNEIETYLNEWREAAS